MNVQDASKAIMPPQGKKIPKAPSFRLGVRQVMKSREAMGKSTSSSSNTGQRDSQLLALLLLKWSWGELPSTFLQEIALAAVQDGCPHPDVIKLSKLGASGMHRGNINRDLQQMMGESMWASSLLKVGLTVQMANKQATWEKGTRQFMFCQLLGMGWENTWYFCPNQCLHCQSSCMSWTSPQKVV